MERFARNRLSLQAMLVVGATLFGLMIAGQRVRGIAFNTLLLSCTAGGIALVLGTGAAMVLVKTNAPLRRAMLAAFAVWLFVPLYLHAGGWIAALGVGGWLTWQPARLASPSAWIDGWHGAIWIHAMAATPWVVCLVSAALAQVERDVEEAALLTAPGYRVLATVSLRAALPGVAVAGLWAVLYTAAEMTVTDFFQIRTFAEEVYTTAAAGGFPMDQVELAGKVGQGTTPSPWEPYVGLVVGIALMSLLMWIALVAIVSQITSHSIRLAALRWRWQLGVGRWFAALVPLAVLALVAALPTSALFYKAGLGTEQTAGGWQRVWLASKLWSELSGAAGFHWRELQQTFWLALGVATTATLLGGVVGWWWRTARRTPAASLAIAALALSVPGPVLGLMVIWFLNHPLDSPLSPLTCAYDQTLLAPWLVQSMRFTPLASLVMAAGLATVPRSTIDAARVDGAGWWGTLWLIAVPNCWPVLASTWLIVAALSVGELAATLLVMPPGPPTLTIRLFGMLHYGVEDRVAAMSLVLLAGLSLVASAAIAIASRVRPPSR